MKVQYLMLVLFFWSQCILAQYNETKVYNSSQFEHLLISNFNGDISVQNSTSDEIELSIKSEKKDFPEGFTVEYVQSENYLIAFLRTPCTKSNEQIVFDENNPFDFFSTHNNVEQDCEMELDPFKDFPKLTIELKIPSTLKLYTSTINGKIDIQNSTGFIMASNVMGDISMKNVHHLQEAKTVNGNIDIIYDQIPEHDVHFSTVNGDIEIRLSKHANLNAKFKSFSGNLFTDFNKTLVEESKITTTKSKDQLQLKLNEYTAVKIGQGGIHFTMETIHGNAYLKAI